MMNFDTSDNDDEINRVLSKYENTSTLNPSTIEITTNKYFQGSNAI